MNNPGTHTAPAAYTAPPPLPKIPKTGLWLNIFFGLQVVLGLIWASPIVSSHGEAQGWAVLSLFVFTFPFHFIFGCFAAWACWKHPESRKAAARVLILPWLLLALPFIFQAKTADDRIISDEGLRHTAVVLVCIPIALGLFAPAWAGLIVPRRMLASVKANVFLLIGQMLVYLPIVLLIAQWPSTARNASSDQQGWILGYGIMAILAYLVVMFLPSISTFLYAWTGLFQRGVKRCIKLMIAQLLFAAPSIAVAMWLISWVLKNGVPNL